MLDRTIPFYNMIFRLDAWNPSPISLPPGIHIRTYRPGDADAWARLHTETGDFDTPADAYTYFVNTYIRDSAIYDRIFFAEDIAADAVVGTCTAWRDPAYRNPNNTVASLHWLAVTEAAQGCGVGRALTCTVLNAFAARGEMPVYIHTQPWSLHAIALYTDLGFRLQKSDSFAHYENQFADAYRTLKQHLPANIFHRLKEQIMP